MEPNELELLKKVLPEGYTVELRQGVRPRFHVLDNEGEVVLQGVSTTARGAVSELMEQSHRNGVNEGRYAAQHEVRTALGITDWAKNLRTELMEELHKLRFR